MMHRLEHPLYSISHGFNQDEYFIGGGGGNENTGVPNGIIKISRELKTFKVQKSYSQPDVVSKIAVYNKDKKYIVFAVVPYVILCDEEMKEISRFDTKTTKIYFMNLEFSPDGKRLLVVDGEQQLRILEVPTLKELYSSKPGEYDQAAFHEQEDHLYIAASSTKHLKLLEFKKGMKIIAQVAIPDLIPKAIVSDPQNGKIYFTGVDKAKRVSKVMCFVYYMSVLFSLRDVCPAKYPVLTLSLHDGLLAAGLSDGSVIFMRTRDLSVKKTIKEVHQMPVTCSLFDDSGYITGGMDNWIVLSSPKLPILSSSQVFALVSLILLALLLYTQFTS